jgi:hypothetical protein
MSVQARFFDDRKELVLNNIGMLSSTDSRIGNNSGWTDDVFTVNNYGDQNASGATMKAMCFTSIEGIQDFGLYWGSDGKPKYVHTGFRPSLVIVKPVEGSTANTGWRVFDRQINDDNNNGTKYALYLNNNNARQNQNGIDFESKGFRIHGNGDVNINDAGVRYMYMAFGEMPGKYSTAVMDFDNPY